MANGKEITAVEFGKKLPLTKLCTENRNQINEIDSLCKQRSTSFEKKLTIIDKYYGGTNKDVGVGFETFMNENMEILTSSNSR